MSGQPLIRYSVDDAVLTSHLRGLIAMDRRGFRRVRHAIGGYLVSRVVRRLHEQRLVDGTAMPRSKAATGRDNKKKKATGLTLIDKGHLRDGYNYQLDGNETITVFGGHGGAKDYTAIHHFGGKTGRGHRLTLPARPVLGMDAEDDRMVGDLLINAIKAAGAAR